mmetsp:Transcript_11827/g.19694  ORF Transcript_11827/g.19694 Transcript_11827/m.19694 type:complete len:931 (-) Transcript_11827:386-3178(-)
MFETRRKNNIELNKSKLTKDQNIVNDDDLTSIPNINFKHPEQAISAIQMLVDDQRLGHPNLMHHWCDGYARAGERGPATNGFFKGDIGMYRKEKIEINNTIATLLEFKLIQNCDLLDKQLELKKEIEEMEQDNEDRKSILNKISQLKTVEKELNKVKIVKMTTVCEEIGRQVAQYEVVEKKDSNVSMHSKILKPLMNDDLALKRRTLHNNPYEQASNRFQDLFTPIKTAIVTRIGCIATDCKALFIGCSPANVHASDISLFGNVVTNILFEKEMFPSSSFPLDSMRIQNVCLIFHYMNEIKKIDSKAKQQFRYAIAVEMIDGIESSKTIDKDENYLKIKDQLKLIQIGSIEIDDLLFSFEKLKKSLNLCLKNNANIDVLQTYINDDDDDEEEKNNAHDDDEARAAVLDLFAPLYMIVYWLLKRHQTVKFDIRDNGDADSPMLSIKTRKMVPRFNVDAAISVASGVVKEFHGKKYIEMFNLFTNKTFVKLQPKYEWRSETFVMNQIDIMLPGSIAFNTAFWVASHRAMRCGVDLGCTLVDLITYTSKSMVRFERSQEAKLTRRNLVSQRERNQTTNGKLTYEERFVAATQKMVERASDIAAAAADEDSVLVVGDAGVKTAFVGLKLETDRQPDSHASGTREPGEPFNEDGAMCIGSQNQVGQFRRDDLIDSYTKLKENIKIKDKNKKKSNCIITIPHKAVHGYLNKRKLSNKDNESVVVDNDDDDGIDIEIEVKRRERGGNGDDTNEKQNVNDNIIEVAKNNCHSKETQFDSMNDTNMNEICNDEKHIEKSGVKSEKFELKTLKLLDHANDSPLIKSKKEYIGRIQKCVENEKLLMEPQKHYENVNFHPRKLNPDYPQKEFNVELNDKALRLLVIMDCPLQQIKAQHGITISTLHHLQWLMNNVVVDEKVDRSVQFEFVDVRTRHHTGDGR